MYLCISTLLWITDYNFIYIYVAPSCESANYQSEFAKALAAERLLKEMTNSLDVSDIKNGKLCIQIKYKLDQRITCTDVRVEDKAKIVISWLGW